MYERFTDRSRKVMQLANQEAQRFNHEYIGTEHILLGLIKEGGGVASEILKGMKIDLRKVRLEVEKIVQSGPNMVIIGKLPQTPRSKKVIEYSMQYARERNDGYVGTFHILLGLLKEGEGVAATILKKFNVTETVLIDAEKNWANQKGVEVVVGILEEEKDAAVSNQDFEKASQIREKIDEYRIAGLIHQAAKKDELSLVLKNQEHIIDLLNELLGRSED